jgi:hypothetical protein
LPEVDRIILTALAKDPKQRFDNIQTFADILCETVQAPPSTRTLSPTIETPLVVPPTVPVSVLQPASGRETLADMEAIPLEPATQTEDVPSSIRYSTEALHSRQKRRPHKHTQRQGLPKIWAIILVTLVLIGSGSVFFIMKSNQPSHPTCAPTSVRTIGGFTPGSTVRVSVDDQPATPVTVRSDCTIPILDSYIDPHWPAGSPHTLSVFNQDGKLLKQIPFYATKARPTSPSTPTLGH